MSIYCYHCGKMFCNRHNYISESDDDNVDYAYEMDNYVSDNSDNQEDINKEKYLYDDDDKDDDDKDYDPNDDDNSIDSQDPINYRKQ
jgi:hypothetical protein